MELDTWHTWEDGFFVSTLFPARHQHGQPSSAPRKHRVTTSALSGKASERSTKGCMSHKRLVFFRAPVVNESRRDFLGRTDGGQRSEVVWGSVVWGDVGFPGLWDVVGGFEAKSWKCWKGKLSGTSFMQIEPLVS